MIPLALSLALPAPSAKRGQPERHGQLEPWFEPNRGQLPSRVRFASKHADTNVRIEDSRATISIAGGAGYSIRLEGARPGGQVVGGKAKGSVSHYYVGHRTNWIQGVPHFAEVRNREVYRGIDWVFHATGKQHVEFDFVVKPNANPGDVRLLFEGADGVHLDGNGDLIIATANGPVVQKRPIAYQEIAGQRRPVGARYRLDGRRLSFDVGEYDRSEELTIDPVLVYSTFLGGTTFSDGVRGIALDNSGNLLITGWAGSTDFPGAVAPPAFTPITSFVAKMNSAGTALLYSAYILGCSTEAIAVDLLGNAYLTGSTSGGSFPIANALQPTPGGSGDAFVMKVSPSGGILYSTFLGGTGGEYGNAIAVDPLLNVYVTGYVGSSDFPIVNAVQTTLSPNLTGSGRPVGDAFVTKINATGTALLYSTFLGGTGAYAENSRAIAVDSAGNAYVTGDTPSLDFPVVNAIQPNLKPSSSIVWWDSFVAKFLPTGALAFSTFLGGNWMDEGRGIAVDGSGNIWVTGSTLSTDFPTFNPLRGTLSGFRNAYVTKLNPTGSSILYSTYLGEESDTPKSIAIDGSGNIYVAGDAGSTAYFSVNAFQPVNAGTDGFPNAPGQDPFVIKLNASGSQVLYSTYLGGVDNGQSPVNSPHGDYLAGMVIDGSGNVYLGGSTNASTTFPTVNAFQATYPGGNPFYGKGFLAKIADSPNCTYSISTTSAAYPSAGGAGPAALTVSNPACTWVTGIEGSFITVPQPVAGTGNVAKTYTVSANSSPNPRTGRLRMSTQTLVVTQDGSTCISGIGATSNSIASGGGPGQVQVTAPGGCTWFASSNVTWITPGAAFGTGNGSLPYTVSANNTASPRTGTLEIGGRYYTVNQAAAACSVTLTASSATAVAAGSSGNIGITAPTGCGWSAVSNAAWITLTGSNSGSGSGTLPYSVAANTSPSSRSGTVTVSGQVFTVNQDAAPCTYQLSAASTTVAHGGGPASPVGVTAIAGCAWTAASSQSWLTITSGASGSGNGSVSYSVAANPANSQRTGTLTIAGITFTVNQNAAPCTYQLSSSSATVSSAAAAGLTVGMTVPSGCSWSAFSNAQWITVTSGASGSGNGTIGYSVAANPSSSTRSGTISIGGVTFTVNQDGAACTFQLSASSFNTGAAGGAGTAIGVTGPTGCPWTAVANAAWITVTSGAQGSGNGNVGYTVAANPNSAARNGTITIAGSTFTVLQAGAGCTYQLSSSAASFGAAAANGAPFNVTAPGGCTWTASTASNWISISGNNSGTGNGNVSYSVAANPGAASRTGTITVADQTFTVNQSGIACTFQLSPTSANATAAGGTGFTTAVTATAGCNWTASSNAGWITITSSASGAGNGSVAFSVAANTSTSARNGTITAAGQTFTVFQAGATPATPTQLVMVSGTPQATQTNTAFGLRLRVRVLDGQGVGVPSASVTFSAPNFGAGGSFTGGLTATQIVTDSQGYGEAPQFTANGTGGAFAVTATSGNLSPVTFTLTNTAGPGIVVTSPTDLQVVAVSNVTVTWNAISGATGYRLGVIQNTGQTVFSGRLAGANSTSAVLNLPEGSFAFSVQACSDATLGTCAGAFGARNFSVALPRPAAPSITAPAAGATLVTSTHLLQWSTISGAASYEVTLVNETTGTTDLFISVLAPATSTIFSMRSGQYRMEVRACTAGCSTPAVRGFTVQLPAVPAAAPLIAGCNVASVSGQNSMTCNWSPVANADLYVIQVIQAGAGPGGGALTVASRQVSATNASFLVPVGSLSVLVQGCNGDGCGPNSQALSVTGSFGNANAPNLGSPVGGSTVDGPTIVLSWNRIPGDNGSNTTYRLYVQDFARNQPALDIVTNQNFWGAQFAPGRRYDALVIANPNSANPIQGPPQGFTTRGTSPLSPTLVSPQHQGSVRQGNVRLGWTPLPSAQLYQYYIARQGAAAAVATGVTTGIETQVPLQVLNGQDTVHTGIVRICGNGLSCTADSDVGWGIWSNTVGGTGVTTFTLTP